jgi:stress-induced morphogen
MLHERIEARLREALLPAHLDVVNESAMHNVPRGSETHFKVLVVSQAFEGLGLVDRHRRINDLLRDEFRDGMHALALRALTPAQWSPEDASAFPSPPCLGGSKT